MEGKAIGLKYTMRSRISIFAILTVVIFIVMPEPEQYRYWSEILHVDLFYDMKQIMLDGLKEVILILH